MDSSELKLVLFRVANQQYGITMYSVKNIVAADTIADEENNIKLS